MIIYLVSKIQIALLLTKKITILEKYSDFANLFLKKSAKVLSECTKINKHAIKFEKTIL